MLRSKTNVFAQWRGNLATLSKRYVNQPLKLGKYKEFVCLLTILLLNPCAAIPMNGVLANFAHTFSINIVRAINEEWS